MTTAEWRESLSQPGRFGVGNQRCNQLVTIRDYVAEVIVLPPPKGCSGFVCFPTREGCNCYHLLTRSCKNYRDIFHGTLWRLGALGKEILMQF